MLVICIYTAFYLKVASILYTEVCLQLKCIVYISNCNMYIVYSSLYMTYSVLYYAFHTGIIQYYNIPLVHCGWWCNVHPVAAWVLQCYRFCSRWESIPNWLARIWQWLISLKSNSTIIWKISHNWSHHD